MKFLKKHYKIISVGLIGIIVLLYIMRRHAYSGQNMGSPTKSNQNVIDPLGDFIKQAPILNIDRQRQQDMRSPVDPQPMPGTGHLEPFEPAPGVL